MVLPRVVPTIDLVMIPHHVVLAGLLLVALISCRSALSRQGGMAIEEADKAMYTRKRAHKEGMPTSGAVRLRPAANPKEPHDPGTGKPVTDRGDRS